MTLERVTGAELVRVHQGVTLPSGVRGRVARWRDDREHAADVAFLAAERAAEARDLRWRTRTALARLGLGLAALSAQQDIGAGLPVVEDIDVSGPDPVLVLAMPPGFLVAQLREASGALAEALGGRRCVFEPVEHHRVRMTVLRADPLESTAALPAVGAGMLVLGRDENGGAIGIHPARTPHLVVQGRTGSGKSIFIYQLLAQLAELPDVEFWCSDPTTLLVRPWPASPDRVAGLLDVGAHVEMLRRLVAEMDRRLPLIPNDADEISPGPGVPLIICCLEEYAGLLRTADQAATKADNPGREVRMLVSRLLAEARKVSIRIWLIVQRAEANLIGGFERSNLPYRLSFSCDNADSIKLLHPDPPPDVVAEHTTALPGVALVSAPGLPLRRMRAPFTSYSAYARAVRSAQPR